MKKLLFALSIVAILFAGCKKNDVPETTPVTTQELKGDITSDVTLSDFNEYNLTGTLSVKAGATLTIPAGTTIKANKGFSNYIIVEQGVQLLPKVQPAIQLLLHQQKPIRLKAIGAD